MVEGNLEGRGGGFPNTSLVWMVHGYNDFLKYDLWRFWHFGVKQGSGEEKIIVSENHFWATLHCNDTTTLEIQLQE